MKTKTERTQQQKKEEKKLKEHFFMLLLLFPFLQSQRKYILIEIYNNNKSLIVDI